MSATRESKECLIYSFGHIVLAALVSICTRADWQSAGGALSPSGSTVEASIETALLCAFFCVT